LTKMPKFVQQLYGKGYSFLEPRLDWARGKTSLLDGAVKYVEVYLPPVVQTADKYIDMTSDGFIKTATGIKTSVAGRMVPVQNRVIDVKKTAVLKVVDVRDFSVMTIETAIDRIENAIDRILPAPQSESAEKKSTDEEQAKAAILPRIAHLPFRVPLRVSVIIYVRGCGAVDSVIVGGRRMKTSTWEKQLQLVQLVQQRSKPLTDKLEPVITGLQKRKASAYGAIESGHQAIVVQVYVIGEKFQQGVSSAAKNSARLAQAVTVRVAGEKRAAFVFTKIGEKLPALKLLEEKPEFDVKIQEMVHKVDVHQQQLGPIAG